MLSARKQLDVITAYREVGTYRGAAEICGVTNKTVKRIVEKDQAAVDRVARKRNYESVRPLVAQAMVDTKGRISALRLLPKAAAAGYAGSDRNFRRLVAQERARYRRAFCSRKAVMAPLRRHRHIPALGHADETAVRASATMVGAVRPVLLRLAR